jgi:L-malate glycosyltransferase
LKILYFSRDYTPHDYRFLSSLSRTSHQVYYLRLEKGKYPSEERSLPSEINLIEWSGGARPASWTDAPRLIRELVTIARKLKPDLVQAGPLQRSALLAALAGLHPLVSMSWGYDLLRDADRNEIWRQATRFVLRHSDLMVGDCETIRRLAVSYGMPDERIVTFPWGIDLSHFSPLDNPDNGKQADRLSSQPPFTLLSTRSWESIYGVETIAQAFIKAADGHPGLRLVMLGDGSQASVLRQIFQNGGQIPSRNGKTVENAAQVIFPGQVGFEDLPNYYRSSDLYVSASHSDGTSISLLEAMACGLPVLVSDIPGNHEWVVPGGNGWLFREGDSEALAMAIRKAFTERSRLPEMGEKARQSVEKRADWDLNFQKMLDVYELIASRNQHS